MKQIKQPDTRKKAPVPEIGTGALRINQTCLSLLERCRAATERAGSLVRELDLPQAKTEGVLQIDKIRMRLALIRIYRRAALSVICFANASSPKGRAEKPERTAHSRTAPFRDSDKSSHGAFFYCAAVHVML